MTFKGTDIKIFTSGFHVCWNKWSMQKKKEVILYHNNNVYWKIISITKSQSKFFMSEFILHDIKHKHLPKTGKMSYWLLSVVEENILIESKSVGIYHNEYHKIL